MAKASPKFCAEIDMLCRIYRAAIKSHDYELARTAVKELKLYGVDVDMLQTQSTGKHGS